MSNLTYEEVKEKVDRIITEHGERFTGEDDFGLNINAMKVLAVLSRTYNNAESIRKTLLNRSDEIAGWGTITFDIKSILNKRPSFPKEDIIDGLDSMIKSGIASKGKTHFYTVSLRDLYKLYYTTPMSEFSIEEKVLELTEWVKEGFIPLNRLRNGTNLRNLIKEDREIIIKRIILNL